jgi:PAS domain S-box-containing protein
LENTRDHFRYEYRALLTESAEELYENAPCGYFSALPDGLIVKVNNTLLKWLGYEREEVLNGKRFQDLLSIGGKIFYETHHAPLIHMQGEINEISYDLLRQDQTKLPVLINAVLVKNEQGEPLLFRTTVFNITDRKKYEVELLRAKKKAEEATRVKSAFLATISHEIRTPMNAIIGVSNLLLQLQPAPHQLEYLNILKVSSENLLNLINDILDFSKMESGKTVLEKKPFHLRNLVQGLLFGLKVKATEKDLEVRLRLDPELPEYVLGDRVKIGQIFTNIVGNAIKFTDQGFVEVNIRLRELTREMASIDFEISDTGIGIPADKTQQIFDEFTQANPEIHLRYGGTGLGLPISQRLLKMYNSHIEVESELGKGSVFRFNLRLPVVSIGEDGSESGQEMHLPFHSLKGLRVLLAEDNETNVFVISRFLIAWEVAYDRAENGAVAIDKIIQHSYDVVLMDLQMPGISGYEAARQIRDLPDEKYQKLPILALSAADESEVKMKIQAAGMNDFVSKPFNPRDLYDKMAVYRKNPDRAPESGDTTSQEVPFSSSQPELAAPSINLEQYRKLTKNKGELLHKLIRITLHDFMKYKTDAEMFLFNREEDAYRSLVHKSKMSIRLLEANRLDALLQRGLELIQSENISEAQLTVTARDLSEEFDVCMQQLARQLPESPTS